MWKVQSQAVRELVFTLADVPFTDVQLRLHVQRKETFSSEAFFCFWLCCFPFSLEWCVASRTSYLCLAALKTQCWGSLTSLQDFELLILGAAKWFSIWFLLDPSEPPLLPPPPPLCLPSSSLPVAFQLNFNQFWLHCCVWCVGVGLGWGLLPK